MSLKKDGKIDHKRVFSEDFSCLHHVDHVGVYTQESLGERRLGDLVFYLFINFGFLKANNLKNRLKPSVSTGLWAEYDV